MIIYKIKVSGEGYEWEGYYNQKPTPEIILADIRKECSDPYYPFPEEMSLNNFGKYHSEFSLLSKADEVGYNGEHCYVRIAKIYVKEL